MCCGCWQEYDSPKIDTPEVRAAALAVAEVYEHCSTGGHLHILIDDWNIDDDFMPGLRRDIGEARKAGADEGQIAAEARCLDLLAAMTEAERASALGLHDGCWGLIE